MKRFVFGLLIFSTSLLNAQNLIPFRDESSLRTNKPIKMGYKNEKGEKVVKAKYKTTHEFTEGLGLVISHKWKYGFVNEKGKEVIDLKFDYASHFSDGMALVRMKNKIGYINKAGKMVIPASFQDGKSFSEGFTSVQKDSNGKWAFINKQGKLITDYSYESAGTFTEGFAKVQIDKRSGFIDTTGKVVLPLEFEVVNNFKNGLSTVFKGNKKWTVRKKGNTLILEEDNVWELPEGKYIGEVLSAKAKPYPNGKGKMEYKNGNSYNGNWWQGKYAGKGQLIIKDTVYEGEFVDGKLQGVGKKYVSDQYVIEGKFEKGVEHGDMTVRFIGGKKRGDIIYLTYINGVPYTTNKYKYVHANGDIYEGVIENFAKEGKGKMKYANGTTKEGYWQNDIFIGTPKEEVVEIKQGTTTYIGFYLLDDKGTKIPHGWGKKIQQDSTIVEGYFLNNKINSGTVYFANGNIYEGHLKDGKYHGKGTYKYPNGAYVSGIYAAGKIQDGHATIRFNNGTIYIGNILNQQPHGKGEMIFTNGQKYVGDFSKGLRNGFGWTYEKGKEYYNKWENGNPVPWENYKAIPTYSYEEEWDDDY